MEDLFDIDIDALEIFNKIYLQNHQDLNLALYDNLYSLNDINAENDYSELYLDKIQRKVIEEYVNSLKVQKHKAVMIAYVKAIDHTVKYMKETKIFCKNDTPRN